MKKNITNSGHQQTAAVSLTVKNASAALDFYTRALGAKELSRIPAPDGCISHAEFMVGDTKIYISNKPERANSHSVAEKSEASSMQAILADNCDGLYQQAVDAGAEGLNSPQDQYWGMRTAIVKDPFGHRWLFAS